MSSSRDKAWESIINEFFTHLTTLSSGSIVVLAALAPDLTVSGWFERGTAILAVVGFFVTIGCGLAAKLTVAQLSSRAEEDERYWRTENLAANWGAAAVVAFVVALVALAVLAIESFAT